MTDVALPRTSDSLPTTEHTTTEHTSGDDLLQSAAAEQVSETAPESVDEVVDGASEADSETAAEAAFEAGPNAFSVLPTVLLDALAAEGITDPTPVQTAVLPDALAGHDVLGRARTGSGKTLAFGIPVLARLAGSKSRPCHPRAIIVVPTRELANQVTKSLYPLAGALGLKLTTVYGGTPYERQTRQLRQRADVVVATPGRLEDLFENGYVFFDDVQQTVLDEADHLCDLGFYPIVDKLIGLTPKSAQRMLLSATLDGDVDRLVRSHLKNPQIHELDPNAGAVTTMTHHTLVVGGFREKVNAAVDLVNANGRTILFTRTKDGAVDLASALSDAGVDAVDLHGDLSQRVRERNLARFSSGAATAVVATDVAARGIHVDGVDLVVHFDPASDPKAYLHRSGRTARAGKEGCVITLATPKFTSSIARMQQSAGVEVRNHDIRNVPTPMTADALAEAGSLTTPSSKPKQRKPRTYRQGGEGRSYGDKHHRGPRSRQDGGRTDKPGYKGKSGGYKSGGYQGGYKSGDGEGGHQGRSGGYKSGGYKSGGYKSGGYKSGKSGYQGGGHKRAGQ